MTEQDDAILRKRMIEEQLVPRGIADAKVLAAMKKIPRHLFLPGRGLEAAYGDYPLPVGEGQTISQPYMVALMTQSLELTGGEKVLEIGTGSGYQAAILAEIAKEVYSVERFESLAENARLLLDGMEYKNIKIKVGDGTEGWDEFAPYDGIIVTAGTPSIPEPLIEQLAEGGRLVIPVGGASGQELILVRKTDAEISEESICGCTFVPLVGKYGWQEE